MRLVKMWCVITLIATAAVGSVAVAEEVKDEQARKEVREVVKRLQARYEKTKDLQADFTQKTMIEGFERPMTSSGKLSRRSCRVAAGGMSGTGVLVARSKA